ncbi:hypothetical protein [Domibacillus sp. PGB-M46]|uniref:hypothetical protein n=1 Tax=Domibacillus sp. PGB-M46 TaxID=2910255 RepID=UPI001F5A2526|nr:hypothetical protein [Domibacillus sp. PGB-M46]
MQQVVTESYLEQRLIELQVNTFGLPYVEGKKIVTSIPPKNSGLLLTDSFHWLKDIITIKFAD